MASSYDVHDANPPATEQATTRIDLSHEPQRAEVTEATSSSPRKPRRNRQLTAVAPSDDRPAESLADPPRFVADPSSDVPEIVIRHADDLSLHLAQRLQEIERREVDHAEHRAELQFAEMAAKAWLAERDQELTARECQVKLREDEVSTRAAAIAAAELAGEQQLKQQAAELAKRAEEIERRAEELELQEQRLRSERAALQQATEKLRAERRREEELQRSRLQQWQTRVEADRAQAERAMTNLQRHRAGLDQRERMLQERENQLKASWPVHTVVQAATDAKPETLETAGERAEAARDHRAALEHRWVAGQLWARLVGSRLTSDQDLSESLEQVRAQLELLYRRERTALEELRASILVTARQCRTAARPTGGAAAHGRAVRPRLAANG